MSRDLIVRPDWGPPTEGFGGRETNDGSVGWPARSVPERLPPRQVKQTAIHRGITRAALELLPLPRTIIHDWVGDPAGPAVRLRNVQNALSIFDELTPYDLSVMDRSWHWLSDGVKHAIMEELALGCVGSVRMAPQHVLDRIIETEEGDILRRHWRARTERNFSRVLVRLARIRGNVSALGVDEIDQLISKLNVPQMVAACICLAEG